MPFYDASTYSRNVLRPGGALLGKLKSLELILNQRGLAKSRNGSFGTIFQVRDTLRNKLFGIKCFTKDIKDRKEHYVKIGNYLSKQGKQNFMEFEYIENGIEVFDDAGVKGKGPVLMMERVEGKSLSEYLENIIKDNAFSKVSNLINKFLELFKILKDLGITHGDLQHGNIIIDKTENIVLIDYDGMYVPGSSTVAVEGGLPDYQHPERRNISHVGADTDEFSKIVIRYGLSLVELDPVYRSNKYGFESGLLFNANDFAAPNSSKIFADIKSKQKTDPKYTSLPKVELLEHICTSPYEDIPSLEDFMNGKLGLHKDKVVYININKDDIDTVVATHEGKKFKIPTGIKVGDEVARFRWEGNVGDGGSKGDLIYKIKTIQTSRQSTTKQASLNSKKTSSTSQAYVIHGIDIYDHISILKEQLGNSVQYKNYLLQIPKVFKGGNKQVVYKGFGTKGSNGGKDGDLCITYNLSSPKDFRKKRWIVGGVIIGLLFLIGILSDDSDTSSYSPTSNIPVEIVEDETCKIIPVNGYCNKGIPVCNGILKLTSDVTGCYCDFYNITSTQSIDCSNSKDGEKLLNSLGSKPTQDQLIKVSQLCLCKN